MFHSKCKSTLNLFSKVVHENFFVMKLKYFLKVSHKFYSRIWERARNKGKWFISVDSKSRGDLQIECGSAFSQSLLYLLTPVTSESLRLRASLW